jgi:hypothetical protein
MITLPKSELDKLERFYNKFSREKKIAIQKEVDRTAYGIDRRAKRDCPVDTGRLRSSIHVITAKGISKFPRDFAGEQNDPLPFTAVGGQAFVGTTVNYAEDVENMIVKTHNGRQPFFSPAVEVEGEKFIENIKKILSE